MSDQFHFEKMTTDLFTHDYIEQCFSTGVPRHISVPWNSFRCAVKSWNTLQNSSLHIILALFFNQVCRQTFWSTLVCREPKKVENHWHRTLKNWLNARHWIDICKLQQGLIFIKSRGIFHFKSVQFSWHWNTFATVLNNH